MTEKQFFKCRYCKGPIDEESEPEFSQELTEVFCDPDCANSHYFEVMRSIPISLEELQKRYPDGK
jgi:hypothetical protein